MAIAKHVFLLMTVLFCCQAKSIPISSYMDRSDPAYYKLVLTRLLQWYEQKTAAPILEKLTPAERSYVHYSLEHISDWAYQVSPTSFWNYFRLTLTATPQGLQTRRLAIGPTAWSEDARKKAEAVLRERNIKLKTGKRISDVLWLEWNLDRGEFAVYYKENLHDIQELISHPEFYESKALRGVFYRAGQKPVERIFVSYKKNPEELRKEILFASRVLQTVDVFRDGKREDRIFELRSFDDRFMKGPLVGLADAILTEFNMPADSLIYRSPEDMEIYYP